jgi:hypothetical protein
MDELGWDTETEGGTATDAGQEEEEAGDSGSDDFDTPTSERGESLAEDGAGTGGGATAAAAAAAAAGGGSVVSYTAGYLDAYRGLDLDAIRQLTAAAVAAAAAAGSRAEN